MVIHVFAYTAWLFELAGGAISDYEDTCIPKSQREASFTVAALHQWEMGVLDDRCRSAAEDWISGTLVPVNQGGPYPTVRYTALIIRWCCSFLSRSSLPVTNHQPAPWHVMATTGHVSLRSNRNMIPLGCSEIHFGRWMSKDKS
jgi:hypothetical protein